MKQEKQQYVSKITMEQFKKKNIYFYQRLHLRIFHAKMGTIKDRNGMDLTETEDIKKRWQQYTEELYKKRSKRPM